MKKFVSPLLAAMCGMFLISHVVKAQETAPAAAIPAVTLGDNVTMKIGGFLRTDAYFDTRKSEELVDGLFNFYPLNESPDPNGNDLNAVSQYRMAATASRLNTLFKGPDVFNAKSSSLIEFDFTGVNGIGLRLRHAWIKLNWEKSELLFGRTWHPLMALEVLPSVVALSTGAPFTVFNRCEQIRYTVKFGQLSAFGALSTQMKYGFPGTAQNQSVPDLNGNIQFKNEFLIVGATANLRMNQPITEFTSTATNRKFKIDDKVTSVVLSGYAQVSASNLKVKGGAMYGQNMHEYLMLGGYAIETIDSTGVKYTTTNNLNFWGNIVYGSALQYSLFLGYTKNLGTSAKTPATYFGRAENIDNLIRIAPSISYKVGKLLYQAEVEHNLAAYGRVDKTDNNKVKDTKSVSNTRVQVTATFFF